MGIFLMKFIPITVLFFLLFMIGLIIYLNVAELSKWRKANKQPVLTLPAKVLSKRSYVLHHLHQFEIHLYYPASIYYFVTFELESGEMLELEMDGISFEQLLEEDTGRLTIQGKEFLEFTDNKKDKPI